MLKAEKTTLTNSTLRAIGGSNNPNSEIEWTSVDDEKHKLDAYTLKPIVHEHALGFDPGEIEAPDYQLALTGDVFRWVLEYAPLETLQRVIINMNQLILLADFIH
jgi:cation-transporting ATPase 13A2